MKNKYVAPKFELDAFNCPICEAYAHQRWCIVRADSIGLLKREYLILSKCIKCNGNAIWKNSRMIYPVASTAPLPSEDMPKDVKDDFIEARDIVNSSSRAAAALLRLALQKLMVHLGEVGKNINDDIGSLVKKGLPAKIQRALDSVRVIGNNAVHPGEIDLKDDTPTALSLFELINIIVEVTITQTKKVEEIYETIPGVAKKAIEKRDKK